MARVRRIDNIEVPGGIYEHCKGSRFLAIPAHHDLYPAQKGMVLIPLEGGEACFCPLEAFVRHDNKNVPRFRFVHRVTQKEFKHAEKVLKEEALAAAK